MGKRSGIPHTDDELEKLGQEELEAELQRSQVRLTIAGSAKEAKQWHKRIHWLEAALAKRDASTRNVLALTSKRLTIYPVYGWGWSPVDEQTIRETPSPFSVLVAEEPPGRWRGTVDAPEHEFHGCNISMGQRHTAWDGMLNVTVEGKATGYASVVALSSSPRS